MYILLFYNLWLVRDVKDSVSTIHQRLKEYVTRKYRTASGAGAFKYESRFETRITQPINSEYWPLYFFRFICVNWLDSFCKIVFPSHNATAVLHLSYPLVCSIVLFFLFHTEIFESFGVREIPVALILDEIINFTCPCILKIIDNQLALGGMLGIPSSFWAKQPGWETFSSSNVCQNVFAAKKASAFVIQCLYSLYNSLGNVTGHHGKHFMVSRRTLHLMAHNLHAMLLAKPGFSSLACGGIVLVPSNNAAAQRGKLPMLCKGDPIYLNTRLKLTYLSQLIAKSHGTTCILLYSGKTTALLYSSWLDRNQNYHLSRMIIQPILEKSWERLYIASLKMSWRPAGTIPSPSRLFGWKFAL